jgi:hypothetical protein
LDGLTFELGRSTDGLVECLSLGLADDGISLGAELEKKIDPLRFSVGD